MNIKYLILISILGSQLTFLNAQSDDVYIPYRSDDKWGFSDTEKNIIVKPRFDEVIRFKNGFFFVNENGKSGLVDLADEMVLECKYEYLDVSKSSIVIRDNNRYRLLDFDGRDVFNEEFSQLSISSINERLVTITTLSKNCGLVLLDETHKKVEKVLMDTIYSYINHNMLPNISALSKDESEIIELQFDGSEVTQLSSEETEEEEVGFMDQKIQKGSNEADAQPSWICSLKSIESDGNKQLVLVKETASVRYKKRNLTDTLHYLFKDVKIVSNPNFKSKFIAKIDSSLWKESKGKTKSIAIVTDENNKRGLVNGDGKLIISCQYDEMKLNRLLRTGQIPYFDVSLDGKKGIINLSNDIVVPVQMDQLQYDRSSVSYVVKKGGLNGILTQKNYCPPHFKEKIKGVDYIANTYFVVKLVDENDKFLGYGNDEGVK